MLQLGTPHRLGPAEGPARVPEGKAGLWEGLGPGYSPDQTAWRKNDWAPRYTVE